nr:hypothetical protein CFP56_11887 [Quercus suber]
MMHSHAQLNETPSQPAGQRCRAENGQTGQQRGLAADDVAESCEDDQEAWMVSSRVNDARLAARGLGTGRRTRVGQEICNDHPTALPVVVEVGGDGHERRRHNRALQRGQQERHTQSSHQDLRLAAGSVHSMGSWACLTRRRSTIVVDLR